MTEIQDKKLRCGMVSIVGRPNVGKSTLLNNILGEKVAIVSRIPQTTRNQIRGVYTDERGQIIFIDTPGLHLGKDKLDKFMNQTSDGMIKEADCIIYLVDTSRRIGEEEEAVADRLKSVKVPVILGLNKVDRKGSSIPEYIAHWEKTIGRPAQEMDEGMLIAMSGRQSINIDKLLDIVFSHMPEGPLLYPPDTICDVPQKMAISDIIREKLFNILKDELPHSVGVVIEQMQPVKGKTLNIRALIMIEKESQKEIVIGRKGDVLKRVGTNARRDLQELLETKVFLELYVKVAKQWRNDSSLLQELGYYNV